MSTTTPSSGAETHVAAYVPSGKNPRLVSLVCSCKRSSYGEMLQDSAESTFEEHRKNPWDARLRDRETTALLFDLADPLNPTRKRLA